MACDCKNFCSWKINMLRANLDQGCVWRPKGFPFAGMTKSVYLLAGNIMSCSSCSSLFRRSNKLDATGVEEREGWGGGGGRGGIASDIEVTIHQNENDDTSECREVICNNAQTHQASLGLLISPLRVPVLVQIDDATGWRQRCVQDGQIHL